MNMIFLTDIISEHSFDRRIHNIKNTIHFLQQYQFIFLIVNVIFLLLILAEYSRVRKIKKDSKKIVNRFNEDGSIRNKRISLSTNIFLYLLILLMTDIFWLIINCLH